MNGDGHSRGTKQWTEDTSAIRSGMTNSKEGEGSRHGSSREHQVRQSIGGGSATFDGANDVLTHGSHREANVANAANAANEATEMSGATTDGAIETEATGLEDGRGRPTTGAHGDRGVNLANLANPASHANHANPERDAKVEEAPKRTATPPRAATATGNGRTAIRAAGEARDANATPGVVTGIVATGIGTVTESVADGESEMGAMADVAVAAVAGTTTTTVATADGEEVTAVTAEAAATVTTEEATGNAADRPRPRSASPHPT